MVAREETLAAGTRPPGAVAGPAGARRVPAHRRYRVHAPNRWHDVHLLDLWAHRHVIVAIGWAYATRMFQGLWLGWLWLPLRPTMQLLQRGLVFGAMLKVGSGDRPYLVFLLVGQASWDFFDRAVWWNLRSFRRARQLKRVRLPWITAVVATVIPAAIDAAYYCVVAVIVCSYYKLTQGSFYITFSHATWQALLGVALLGVWIIAVGSLAAPLVYKIPDTRYLLRYLLGFLVYLTPVIYPTSSLRGFQVIAEYNPLTAPIELIKNGLLQTGAPSGGSMLACLVGLVVLLPIGLLAVARTQRSADASL
jgi:lipopolysaccharide transport system permease protein